MKLGFGTFIGLLIGFGILLSIATVYYHTKTKAVYREGSKIMLALYIYSFVIGIILIGLYYGGQIC